MHLAVCNEFLGIFFSIIEFKLKFTQNMQLKPPTKTIPTISNCNKNTVYANTASISYLQSHNKSDIISI